MEWLVVAKDGLVILNNDRFLWRRVFFVYCYLSFGIYHWAIRLNFKSISEHDLWH